MTENVEFQPWMDSPWVMTIDDINDQPIEDVIDVNRIAWFDVNMDLSDTEQERNEKVKAQQEQIEWGILQPNGYPVGMKVPQGANLNPHFKAFNFPGAIGMPGGAKFSPTPITRQLQAAAASMPTKQPRSVPGILPTLPMPQKVQDRNVFEKGNDRLKRIQELTRDRRR